MLRGGLSCKEPEKAILGLLDQTISYTTHSALKFLKKCGLYSLYSLLFRYLKNNMYKWVRNNGRNGVARTSSILYLEYFTEQHFQEIMTQQAPTHPPFQVWGSHMI